MEATMSHTVKSPEDILSEGRRAAMCSPTEADVAGAIEDHLGSIRCLVAVLHAAHYGAQDLESSDHESSPSTLDGWLPHGLRHISDEIDRLSRVITDLAYRTPEALQALAAATAARHKHEQDAR
jgi:hypothetical protein